MRSERCRDATRENWRLIRYAFTSGHAALVFCSLGDRPIPVICIASDSNVPDRPASYIPLAILVDEYHTDLFNELVPPPTLFGRWQWTHVPQRMWPPPPNEAEST